MGNWTRHILLVFSLISSILFTSEKSLAVSSTTDFIYDLAGGRANWTNNQAFGDFYISDGGTTDTSNVTHGDLYDQGMFFEVCAGESCAANGTYTPYAGVGTANSSTGYYTGATKLTSSLSVTASYRFSKTIAAGRMLVQLENTTSGNITKQVRVRTNLGSDDRTYLKYQSSTSSTLANHYTFSSTPYSSSSLWFITSDQGSVTSSATGGDPVASFVFGKSGATVSPTTMFVTDNMYTMFTVTIPANSSRYMMFAFGMGGINPLNNTMVGAYNGVTTYLTDFANWPSDLTSDLTNAQISGLLNWVVAPSVVSFTSRANYSKTGASIYDLTFSEAVSDLAANDFSFTGTSTGCSVSSVSGSGSVYIVETIGCAEGSSVLTLASNSITGTQSGPLSSSSANSVSVDLTAPTISSVTGPANATYRPTQALTFSVATSETVTVTGTPRLALTIGSTTRYANYASGSNTRTLLFTYTVATSSSDIDSDGIAVSTTLDLNSGTIVDLASNAMSLLTFSAPTLTSVLVAQPPAAPTIDSITASSGQISIAFTAGATNGAAIENYEYSTNNGVNWTTRSPVATTSPIIVSGLSNGTTYNVRLRAINSAGTSDSSTAVSATPTAVVVGGGSNISTTYGLAASSSQFTATGGTSPYTFTLSSTPTGVSISNGVVTASATTNAGTYTQNVVATDATSQSGTKQIVITVGQVTPTITIALTGGVTDAALGSAITITATVSQGGSVNFRLGGSSISGCSSVSSTAGSATCSWTPASLGGVVLTAVLTPTDSTNYTNATSSNLNITVVNGVTTVSLSLAGGVTTVAKGQFIVITATVDQAGRISFTADGKRLPGCTNLSVSGVSKTCNWKPAVRKQVNLAARLVPTNSAYSTTSASLSVLVISRTGPRT
jgi:hypothetical protein